MPRLFRACKQSVTPARAEPAHIQFFCEGPSLVFERLQLDISLTGLKPVSPYKFLARLLLLIVAALLHSVAVRHF